MDDTPARSNKRSSSETTDDSISSKHPRIEMCAGGNAPVVDGDICSTDNDLDSFPFNSQIFENRFPYVVRQSNIQCKHKC